MPPMMMPSVPMAEPAEVLLCAPPISAWTKPGSHPRRLLAPGEDHGRDGAPEGAEIRREAGEEETDDDDERDEEVPALP
jgi:hypothetical protein